MDPSLPGFTPGGYGNYGGEYDDYHYGNAPDTYGGMNEMNPYATQGLGTAVHEPGFYYPLEGLEPQIFGAPVSALAYDQEYEAIFVASETQSLSRGASTIGLP